MANPELALGELRSLMFSVAYRMLGSVTEAEDVVQEACLRMHAGAPGVLRSAEAYAVTVTARLPIDALRSARRRRERYIGPWLPDPLTGPDQADLAWRFEMDETVSMAFLVLLEKLTPVERAVFLLREVFGYPYADVADVVGKSEAACRKALHRARQHLRDSRSRFVVPTAERDRLAGRFFAAVRDGDLADLEAMLSDDVVFYGDGGGQAPAVREPVRGATRVARFVLGLARQARRLRIQLEPVLVNGQPGARALAPDGTIQAVLSLDISDSQVGAIYNQINPGKLSHVAARTPRTSTPATPAGQVTGGRGEGREKPSDLPHRSPRSVSLRAHLAAPGDATRTRRECALRSGRRPITLREQM